MDVFGVEADGLQDSQRLGQNLVADAVAGHGHYGVLSHSCSFSFHLSAVLCFACESNAESKDSIAKQLRFSFEGWRARAPAPH